jgi:hypothetical protein
MNMLLSLALITTCALAQSAEQSTGTVRDNARSEPVVLSEIGNPLPSADDVVAKMLELDARRQSELTGYTAVRRYVAVNKQRRAEMLVRVSCDSNGAKQFTIVSEQGSGAIRKHVFHKLLTEEAEASRRGNRNSNRLIPDNYQFQMVAQENLDSGPAYALKVVPKTANKYLIDGKVWVDARDYSIIRIEGKPARNPSFWVRSVHFEHTYQKVGQFWFALSTRSDSQLRIFGDSVLAIDTSDYLLNPPANHTAESHEQAAVVR